MKKRLIEKLKGSIMILINSDEKSCSEIKEDF